MRIQEPPVEEVFVETATQAGEGGGSDVAKGHIPQTGDVDPGPGLNPTNQQRTTVDEDEVLIEDWFEGDDDEDDLVDADEAAEGGPANERRKVEARRYTFQEAKASVQAAQKLARKAGERRNEARRAHEAAAEQTRRCINAKIEMELRECQAAAAARSREQQHRAKIDQVTELTRKFEQRQAALEELRV